MSPLVCSAEGTTGTRFGGFGVFTSLAGFEATGARTVAHDQLPLHLDSQGVKVIGEKQRVRIEPLRRQHLRTYRDDFSIGHSLTSVRGQRLDVRG